MNTIIELADRCRALVDHQVMSAVQSIVVGGSLGRGEASEDSDVDLFLLVSDDDLTEFLSQGMRAMSMKLGSVMLFRGPVFVEGFGYSFTVLYETSLLCQFNVNSYSTLIPNAMWNPNCPVLFDRTGYYTQLLRKSNEFLDNTAVFKQSFTVFWLRALIAFKYIKRGDLWSAISLLDDLRNQMLILERLMNGIHPPGMNYRFPSKAFERQMGQNTAKALEPSLPTYSYDSIIDALYFSVNWFLEASKNYAAELSIVFHEELSTADAITQEIGAKSRDTSPR